MNRKLFGSFVGISLLISLVLGASLMAVLRSLNESGEGRIRYPALRFLARFVEHEQNPETALNRFEALRKRLGLKSRPVWIITASGQIIAETPPRLPLPLPWRSLTKPLPVHRIIAHYQTFHLTPDYMAIRLKSPEPTFLLLRTSTSTSFHRFIMEQAILLFSTMAASTLAGLTITFAYLRYKSREAKAVMGQLEKGNLKARFPMTRLDEAGSLISDFNRMAGAIEQIVRQTEETDKTRKELLQELGHDLKTPMTSLRAAVDTIIDYRQELSPADLEQLIRIIQAESHYFLRMTDDLFLIAEIGNSRWQRAATKTDLTALLEEEMEQAGRRAQATGKRVVRKDGWGNRTILVTGDALLLKRLFRNALENALRFADSEIRVGLSDSEGRGSGRIATITITDDGPGVSPDEVTLFGKRRNRILTGNNTISMGLGSVIMAAIVKAHGGHLSIRNRRETEDGQPGTVLLIQLPVEPKSPFQGFFPASIILQ